LIEFDNMVEKLKKIGIDVKVMQDTKEPHTPDSIFPNNWFSTHYSNTVVLYPMFAENRRLERTDRIYDFFEKDYRMSYKNKKPVKISAER